MVRTSVSRHFIKGIIPHVSIVVILLYVMSNFIVVCVCLFLVELIGALGSFINVLPEDRKIFCKICKARIGHSREDTGCLLIRHYNVLRVEPLNFVSACSSSSECSEAHEHLFFTISTEKFVTEQMLVPRLLSFKDETLSAEVCKFSNIAKHLQSLHPGFRSNIGTADIAIQTDESGIAVSNETEDFIRCFYRQLFGESIPFLDMYSSDSIRSAVEAAKMEILMKGLDMEVVHNESLNEGGVSVAEVDSRSSVYKKVIGYFILNSAMFLI